MLGFWIRVLGLGLGLGSGLGLRFRVKVNSSRQCTTTSSGVLTREKKILMHQI